MRFALKTSKTKIANLTLGRSSLSDEPQKYDTMLLYTSLEFDLVPKKWRKLNYEACENGADLL